MYKRKTYKVIDFTGQEDNYHIDSQCKIAMSFTKAMRSKMAIGSNKVWVAAM